MGKKLSGTYSANKVAQKCLDSAQKSGTAKSAADAFKTAIKSAIQKTAETSGDLIGNKSADKITGTSFMQTRYRRNIHTTCKKTKKY